MVRRNSYVCEILLLLFVAPPSEGYLQQRRPFDQRNHHCGSRGIERSGAWSPPCQGRIRRVRFCRAASMAPHGSVRSTRDLNGEISRLCDAGEWDGAVKLLDRAVDAEIDGSDGCDGRAAPNSESFTLILTSMASAAHELDEEKLARMEDVFARLSRRCQRQSAAPTRAAYHPLIVAWSASHARYAGERCAALLTELWSHYHAATAAAAAVDPVHWCPSHATYVAALTALARSQGGRRAAERAEALLEEMEQLGHSDDAFAHLKPTSTCFNIVL